MIQIDNNTKVTSKYVDVDKIMELVGKNPNIAKLICNICLVLGMEEDKGEKLSPSRIDIIIDRIYSQYEMIDEIDQSEFDEVISIWNNFDTHKRGNFLERLILFNGAYQLSGDNIRFVYESKIYHEKITTNHNFDAIFYNEEQSNLFNDVNRIEIINTAEYHECKNDICKWLPCNMRDFFSLSRYADAKRKLLFINKVHKIVKKNGYFYMPTLAFNVTGRQNCLDRNHFGFIKILNIQDIMDRYYNEV